MAVQGGNAIDHGKAYAGMVADGELANKISKLNKGVAGIAYGKGVVTDGEDGAKLPEAASTAAQFNGVVVYELNRAHRDGEVGAVPGYDMTVMTTGVIWVTALETVAKDSPVYLRVGANGTGDFSGLVGAGPTLSVLIPNAKFVSGADAGKLAKISLNVGG